MTQETRAPLPPNEIRDNIRDSVGDPENRFDEHDEVRWMQTYYLWCIAWDMHQLALMYYYVDGAGGEIKDVVKPEYTSRPDMEP